MGQYWNVLDIDNHEKLRNRGGLKLWEIVNSGTAQQLVGFLASTPRKGLASDIGRFSSLPIELFIVLTSFLTDSDVVLLGLTCRTMWLNLQAQIREALIADAAPWSCHRIITLGDYARAHPPNLLTHAEETELQRHRFEDNQITDSDDDENPATVSLYYYAYEHYTEAKRNVLRQTVEEHLDHMDAAILTTLLRPLYDFANDEDGYVLRNLSKHEYVCGNALVELCGSRAKGQQPFIQPVGFGELIVLRTQWTDDPSGTMGPSLKGPWAGDRFDIVPMKMLERVRKDRPWTVVTRNATEMLKKTMSDKLDDYR